jgi:hypothetical protein
MFRKRVTALTGMLTFIPLLYWPNRAYQARDVVGNRLTTGVWNVEVKRDNGANRYQWSVQRTDWNGQRALVSIQSAETGVDSTIVRASDLMPIAFRAHNQHEVRALDFAGTRVTGSVVRGGKTESVVESTPVSAFDASTLNLVIGALPLKNGYASRFPFYAFYLPKPPRIAWYSLEVTGDTTIAGRTAWRVNVREGDNVARTTTMFVDSATRMTVLQRTAPRNGQAVVVTRTPR